MVNSADTGVVGDTNGDGMVDDADTAGMPGDTNGDGVVNAQDEIVGDDINQDGVVDEADGGESTKTWRLRI